MKSFENIYSSNIQNVNYKDNSSKKESLLSLSAFDMPFMTFARWLSDNSSVGLVYDSALDSQQINSEFKNATTEEIINTVARRFNLDVVKIGSTFFLGQLKPEDRGLLVKKVRGFGSEQLQTAISVFLSEHGKLSVYPDGTCVVSDRESILKRISDMLDKIESNVEASWIIQLYFVSLRSGVLKSAGVKVKPSGDLAYNISRLNDSGSKDLATNFDLNAELNLGFNSDFAEYRATPMLLLRDGVSGVWSDGESVPIPQKTVSDQGTVTTTGYQYQDTGLIVNLNVRDSKVGAIIKIDVTESQVTGYVDQAPILNKSFFKGELVISTNQIYLIGELKRKRKQDSIKDFMSLNLDSGASSYQIWARVYRISGSALTGSPSSCAGDPVKSTDSL